MLVNQGRLAEAQPHLAQSLVADPQNVGANFLQLQTLLGRHPDKAAALQLTQNLAKPFPNEALMTAINEVLADAAPSVREE